MKKFLIKIFGLNKPRCPHCNSNNLQFGFYTRAWNEYCNQASGDFGYWCYNCSKTSFIKSHEDYMKTLPNWVKSTIITKQVKIK